MSPAVSVVTPVWNAAATLAEAVASVQAQTRGDWELLVVDDGSTDGGCALAEALAAGDPRIPPAGRAGAARRGGGPQRGNPRGARPVHRLPRRR